MNQQPMMPQAPAPTQQPMAPAPWEPKSLESPLERAFDTLDGRLSAIEKTIGTLIDRISPVLAPQAPQAPQQPGAPKPATPPCSDVVRVVNSQSDKLAALIARVEAVTTRVEL